MQEISISTKMKTTGIFSVLIFHILFCVYGSMLCLYECSSFIHDAIRNTHWIWHTFFYPDETMICYVVIPLCLFGVISSLIIIVIMIRDRNAITVIPACGTLAITLFLHFFVLWSETDRFPGIVYGSICWASVGWYLFDIIYVIRYFDKRGICQSGVS